MLSYVLAFLTILGVYLIAQKKTSGWLVNIVGNIGWCFYAIITHQPGLLICDFALTLVQVHGYRKWHKENGQGER